jgi:hypothetical protein
MISTMNPYAEIRKVPLDYNGMQSSAYSVQYLKEDKWSEVGVVSNKYMLLPNSEVKQAADQVASEVNHDFEPDKTFFDGKRFIYSFKSTQEFDNISTGDDLAFGMQFWNSYDGSKSFGFSMFLYRLICSNGMMSKKFFNNLRFKHEPNSENWQESLDSVVQSINGTVQQGYNGNGMIGSFVHLLGKLSKLNVTTDILGDIRHKNAGMLSKIPVGTWGPIVDRFTDPNSPNDKTGWGLVNSATDILWHKEKPTMASYNQNAEIMDGLCHYVA